VGVRLVRQKRVIQAFMQISNDNNIYSNIKLQRDILKNEKNI